MIALLLLFGTCFANEPSKEIFLKETQPKKMATAIFAFVLIANVAIYSPIIIAKVRHDE